MKRIHNALKEHNITVMIQPIIHTTIQHAIVYGALEPSHDQGDDVVKITIIIQI